MKTALLIFVWGLWLGAPSPALSGNPAGIVLYSRIDNEVYLLIADHAPPSMRGWAAFGGSPEKGETPAQTAAREAEEETRGFYGREFLLEKIKNQVPVYDGKFALYFAEVKFVPAERFQARDVSAREAAFHERGPYAWVPYSEVKRYLDPGAPLPSSPRGALIDPGHLPRERHTGWFWRTWLQNMRQAVKGSALPW